MTYSSARASKTAPLALAALTVGAFGIGVTEFVIMGLLIPVAEDLGVSISAAGLLISGYALGVVVGAPVLTIAMRRQTHKQALLALMLVFTIGNMACAVAPSYELLMGARVMTALAHGSFFGIGAVVAANIAGEEKRASAVSVMFMGLTIATVLGVPLGTWIGQAFGWRATFWSVATVGIIALIAVSACLPPPARYKAQLGSLKADLGAAIRPQVALGLATTVLGYAGVFTVFTYIGPLLAGVTGLSETSVPPMLLLFGGGLVLGNLIGGRLADKHLRATVIGTLLALAIVLIAMTAALRHETSATLAMVLFGAAAFATVPPLQAWVMSNAREASETLISSINIAAFNLGNALGAGLGSTLISYGIDLTKLPLIAALVPLFAVRVALLSMRRAPQNAETSD